MSRVDFEVFCPVGVQLAEQGSHAQAVDVNARKIAWFA